MIKAIVYAPYFIEEQDIKEAGNIHYLTITEIVKNTSTEIWEIHIECNEKTPGQIYRFGRNIGELIMKYN